ncbi:MAG: FGGY family carbohydrate kinase [Pseudonocardiaceae bacterium]
MTHVLLLDVGGSTVKATAHGPGVHAEAVACYPSVTTGDRVEVDPEELWTAVLRAGRDAVAAADGDCAGITVCTLRQGFALLDADGAEVGPLRPNTDRSGASCMDVHSGRYGLTGHWPAPELTLPKLLALRDTWPRVRTLLFWHDWLLHRLGASPVSGVDYVCGGGMADVAARSWATDWLADLGLPATWLPPVVEAGTWVGSLAAQAAAVLGLPTGTPLHSGPGDTQLAAAGCGGLAAGTVTVVAGSSTPVQLAVDSPATGDPERHPWVSTHARPDRWALEGNAGYPGAMRAAALRLVGAVPHEDVDAVAPGAGGLLALVAAPYWSEQVWARRAPHAIVGWQPATTPAQLVAAVEEAHGYAVRGNVEDLERVMGGPLDVLVAGPPRVAQRIADVLGHPVRTAAGQDATGAAGWSLVTGEPLPGPGPAVTPSRGDYDEPYQRWRAASLAMSGLAVEPGPP